MKIKFSVWIIFCLLVLNLAACRADQATPEETPPTTISSTRSSPVEEQPEGESAYPQPEPDEIEESYPIPEAPLPPLDAAYPITEEDLRLLFQTWTLESYSEDGVSQEPEDKTLTFKADGTYEVTTEAGTATGEWRTLLSAAQSTLILDSDTGEILTYEIVDLTEGRLHLSTVRDEVIIEEGYLPAD